MGKVINVGVFGASGRVGSRIVEAIGGYSECRLASVFIRSGASLSSVSLHVPQDCLVTDKISSFLEVCDIVIDFSLPQACSILLDTLIAYPKPLVSGTTGLSSEALQKMQFLSSYVPVLYSRNMSKGIAVLSKLVSLASRMLPESDIEVFEIHHRSKKDSPSGTALHLAECGMKARGWDESSIVLGSRNLQNKDQNSIHIASLRGGDVVGRHTVGFYMSGEYMELTHNATSRFTFVKGAIEAAIWLVKQDANFYSMQDLFNIYA